MTKPFKKLRDKLYRDSPNRKELIRNKKKSIAKLIDENEEALEHLRIDDIHPGLHTDVWRTEAEKAEIYKDDHDEDWDDDQGLCTGI